MLLQRNSTGIIALRRIEVLASIFAIPVFWKRWVLFFCTLTVVWVPLNAQEKRSFQLPQDAELIIKLKNLETGQAPFVSHGLLFFTYKGTPSTQAVSIAFAFEGFSKLHMLERNDHNVFIYAIPIPSVTRIAYRYWIDGLWQIDPNNPNTYYDSYKVPISFFENQDSSLSTGTNPLVVNGNHDFYVEFDPGGHVYILGNFNNWNPFISPLKEIEPGKYYIRIKRLQPGDYQYYFWVTGFKLLDPRNFRVALNDEGEKVSIFTVLPPPED